MFREALADILSRLEQARAHGLLQAYALIGGFAVSTWGVPRATQDIDFAVAIGSADPQALATFIGGRYEAGGLDDPLRGVVHVSIEVGSEAVSLQLIFLSSALEDVAFRRVATISVMERVIPVVSWQGLVLLKLYAGGPQDKLDAHQILRVRHPTPDDLQQIAEMAESLGILKEWTALLSVHQTGN
ncbi:MAG: hypothetical protein C4293_09700 [Nitrospiraceae bacterium]